MRHIHPCSHVYRWSQKWCNREAKLPHSPVEVGYHNIYLYRMKEKQNIMRDKKYLLEKGDGCQSQCCVTYKKIINTVYMTVREWSVTE